MKIQGIDQQSLDILAPERAAEARKAAAPVNTQNQEAAVAQPSLSLGSDLDGLQEAHSLDADRVAALITDPFGD